MILPGALLWCFCYFVIMYVYLNITLAINVINTGFIYLLMLHKRSLVLTQLGPHSI